MRKPSYLSPSALMLWNKDPLEYYRKYCAPVKPPGFLQTDAMSVGSSFDAFVKAEIASSLGLPSKDGAHSFERLFEESVEPHNRDFALKAGKHVFDTYVSLGALASLMLDISKSDAEPLMESKVQATVGGVPLSGKPDLLFRRNGMPVIIDWKVNGYMSARTTSPRSGYVSLWADPSGPPKEHKDAIVHQHDCGIGHNVSLDCALYSEWSLQTSTYAWCLLGEVPSTPYVKIIDQIVGPKTKLRVARHSYLSSKAGDEEYFNQYADLWDRVSKGQVLSDEEQQRLDLECQGFARDDDDPHHDEFLRMTRKPLY